MRRAEMLTLLLARMRQIVRRVLFFLSPSAHARKQHSQHLNWIQTEGANRSKRSELTLAPVQIPCSERSASEAVGPHCFCPLSALRGLASGSFVLLLWQAIDLTRACTTQAHELCAVRWELRERHWPVLSTRTIPEAEA